MLYKNQLIDGKEYYFDPVTGVLKYGFYESDGKIYYIDKFYNKLCGTLSLSSIFISWLKVLLSLD